jgi:hypothetical protein
MKSFFIGALARLLLVLPACWLAFHIGHAVLGCRILRLRSEDCFEHVLVMPFISLFLPARNTPYLLIILAALLIAGAWAAVPKIGVLQRSKK